MSALQAGVLNWRGRNESTIMLLLSLQYVRFLKKNLNASKPSNQSKGLHGNINIGCRDKSSA